MTFRRISRGKGGTRDGRVLSRLSPANKIAFLPTPDRGFGRIRAPHDLVGAAAICRRQNDLSTPDDLARRISVGEQCLKLLTVSRAEV